MPSTVAAAAAAGGGRCRGCARSMWPSCSPPSCRRPSFLALSPLGARLQQRPLHYAGYEDTLVRVVDCTPGRFPRLCRAAGRAGASRGATMRPAVGAAQPARCGVWRARSCACSRCWTSAATWTCLLLSRAMKAARQRLFSRISSDLMSRPSMLRGGCLACKW